MKRIHIFAIIVIAIAIGLIVSTAGDASTYVTFGEAEELAQEGETKAIHVVGKLKKENGQIVGMKYEPVVDVNRFEFLLIDNKNREQKVIYGSPKPPDFDQSEQVVVIGRMAGDHFECEKILMKCPSKYNDGKMEMKEATAKKV
jgi:cytochrome c-type biogenesis protein CcmE